MNIINELEVDLHNDDKIIFYNTKPISFIERYCSKLNISSNYTKLCQFVAIQVEKRNIMPENTPHSVAAGIIYFVAQEFNLNINKKDINVGSEISEVTIKKCYRKIEILKIPSFPKYFIIIFNLNNCLYNIL